VTRVLVAGGTGVLGREVVSRRLATGSILRVMSRSPQRGTTNAEWAQAHVLTTEGLVSSSLPLRSNSLRKSDRASKER
jgi:NAD dependent epimerase/dehydratase family enzyme